MPDNDWTIFVTRIAINATMEKIYTMWATRAGMEYWFLRMSEFKKPDGSIRGDAEYVEKNDTYQWRWFGWPDEVTEEGTILDCNGNDHIKFSFGKAGICTVNIKEEKGNMMVELVQENIPTDEESKLNFHVGCKTGWTFYLTNLKSLLEGGIDLRNKNEDLKNVINS